MSSDNWAILADKGYQDETEVLRVLRSNKEYWNIALSWLEEARNRQTPSNCIIVKIIFGRLTLL